MIEVPPSLPYLYHHFLPTKENIMLLLSRIPFSRTLRKEKKNAMLDEEKA